MIIETDGNPNKSYGDSYREGLTKIKKALKEKRKVKLCNNRFVKIYSGCEYEVINGVNMDVLHFYFNNIAIDENDYLYLRNEV